MANNNKNEQLKAKADEQHKSTRQRLENVPNPMDIEHLYEIVNNHRIENGNLQSRIETMEETVARGFAADDVSIEVFHERVDTLRDNHEFLRQAVSDIAKDNDEFKAEVPIMKSVQAENVKLQQTVDHLATVTESLSEAATVSDEKTRERIGTLRSDIRGDYKDMLQMIADVKKENSKLQDKVTMMDETMAGQTQKKEHDQLRSQVVEHEDIIAMVRQHLCSLDNGSGAVREKVNDLVKETAKEMAAQSVTVTETQEI